MIATTEADFETAAARMKVNRDAMGVIAESPMAEDLSARVARGEIIVLTADCALLMHFDEGNAWYVSWIGGPATGWRTLFKTTCGHMIDAGKGGEIVRWTLSNEAATVAQRAIRPTIGSQWMETTFATAFGRL